jgi:heme exporter protein B
VSSLVALGVLLLVVFTIAHDPTPEQAPLLAPSVLWATFVFTGLLGVQRSFLLEREQDCLAGLLLAPIDPSAIFAGKLAANLVLLGAMQAIIVPLTGLFLRVDFLPVLPGLLVVLTLGNVGFASAATLFAAIAVRTRAREVLLPLLLLPLVLPVLIAAFELIYMRPRWWAVCLRAAPFAAVPVVFALWTRVVLGYSDLENTVGPEAGGPLGYALAQTRAHLVYFFNFVWPVNMRQMPLLTPPAGWIDPTVALTVLIVSTWLTIKLSARLFRVGMLLTGARPKFREILRQARLS